MLCEYTILSAQNGTHLSSLDRSSGSQLPQIAYSRPGIGLGSAENCSKPLFRCQYADLHFGSPREIRQRGLGLTRQSIKKRLGLSAARRKLEKIVSVTVFCGWNRAMGYGARRGALRR